MNADKQYESLKEKLKKLQALAERGWQGEAENARRLLEKLCRQYGVSLEEILDDSQVKRYTFAVGRNKMYGTLFMQCYAKVTNQSRMKYHQLSRSEISIELTALQYAELKSLYVWHKANLERDLEDIKNTVVEAYIVKHALFSEKSSDKKAELTPEDFVRLKKILAMREALNDNHYQKLIE